MNYDQSEIDTFRSLLKEMRSVRVSTDDVQAGLSALHARISAEEAAGSEIKSVAKSSSVVTADRKRVGAFRRYTYALAGIMAGLCLFFAGWQVNKQLQRPGANSDSAHVSRIGFASTSIYTTGNGERARVTLPDGSTVLLNAASKIRISDNYVSGERTIDLDGEALFTVVPKTSSPFTVNAGSGSVKVLGTTFMVRHYPTDTATLVAVKDGKVSVQSSVLTANQEVNVMGSQISAVRTAGGHRFSFATGVLELTDMTLEEAIPDLNRWYNADIRIADPGLKSRRVAGGFVAGSLDALEEILSLTLNCRVVRSGHVITLYPV